MSGRPAADPDLVSVVTPCYNGEEYLAETIEAVLAQSHPRIEMVVVDDGSTDGSWEVIRSYGDRITAVRQENGGLPNARNAGVARARGGSLLFLDSDDLIAPDTVAALVEAAREGPGDLVACRWRRLAEVEGEWRRLPPEIPMPREGADPLRTWLEGTWLPVHSILWPRELFERVGGFDERLSANEDGDLACRAFARGARLRLARGGECFYRTHGTTRVSMSRDVFSDRRLRSRALVLEKLTAELERAGRWEAYRRSVGIAYQRLALSAFESHPDLARDLLRRGEEYAGRRAVSRTLAGRLLARTVGMERKERIVSTLARWGLMTSERRKVAHHRELMASGGEAAGE